MVREQERCSVPRLMMTAAELESLSGAWPEAEAVHVRGVSKEYCLKVAVNCQHCLPKLENFL